MGKSVAEARTPGAEQVVVVSMLLWFVGFGLMLASFTFLFGRSEDADQPRISVEPWWPEQDQR